MKHEQNLIWIDLEMTGLLLEEDTILEIAVVITDGNLQVVAQGPSLVIYHPEKVLEAMGQWCKTQHAKSGLIVDVQQSAITMEHAQQEVLDFLQEYTFAQKSPLCGSSVWVDRMFLRKCMPRIESHAHYRNVDVSSVKELITRWYPIDIKKELPSKDVHRALEDIYESINELKYYRQNFFIPSF